MIKRLSYLLIAAALAGCAVNQPIVIDASCVAFTPIHPSRQDSAGTLRQVLAHNTMWREICTGERLTKDDL